MIEDRMGLIAHLEEFRKRFIRALLGVLVGFLATYGFAEQLFNILAAPLVKLLPAGSHLTMLGISEGFFTQLKLAFYAGLILAAPWVLYQIWAFVSPGLYPKEKRYFLPFFFVSIFLFMVGVVFAYFVVFPFGFEYLLTYAKGPIVATLSIEWYATFAVGFLVAFGVIFQLPLFLFFLNLVGVVTDTFLRRNRRYALLLAFIIGAILTPPDVVTQTLMSVPLFLLYELSIWLIFFFGRKKKKEEPEPAAAPAG
jgi:sec-independent protein translocase protein TatC